MQIESRDYRVQLTTRAYTGGPSGQGSQHELELDGIRPSAVVHGMRWWYRALAGGIIGATANELDQIREYEGRLFGSTGRPSRIRVRTATEGQPQLGVGVGPVGGPVAYLAYRRGTGTRYFKAFENVFHIVLSAPGEIFELAACLLKLYIRFGGYGARTRHGLGSMWLPEEPVGAIDAFCSIGEASNLVATYLSPIPNRPDPYPEPLFPVVHSTSLRLLWKRLGSATESDVLALCKDLWRTHRVAPGDRYSRNCQLFHDLADWGKTTRQLRYAMLGLPLPFSVTNPAGVTGTVNWQANGARLASPIWIRPFCTELEGTPAWDLAILAWKFNAILGRSLKATTKRTVGGEQKTRSIPLSPPPTLAAEVDDFANYLHTDGSWTEVPL